MSYESFNTALKSTIDYYAKQLADNKSLPFVDLDAAPFNSDVFESDQPAICWEYSTLTEMPRDPLWYLEFDIGAMTMQDPAQYVSLDLVGSIGNLFKIGSAFTIMDYSGVAMPTQPEGRFLITNCGVTPQQSDRVVGLRFVTVTARATRFP